MPALAAAALIALLAMVVRGVTGFGAALVMSPLLLLLFDVHTAVVASAGVQILTALGMVYHARGSIDRSYLKIILPAGVAGILIGTVVLVSADGEALKRLLGVLVVLFALRTLWSLLAQQHTPRLWPRWTGYIAGLLSGFLGTLFGTTGPPVIVYLDNQALYKAAMRATLMSYFLVIDSVRLSSYILSGLVTYDVLVLALVMLPTALLGGWLGTRLHLSIGERTFRLSVGLLLLVTGGLLIVKF